MTMGYLALPRVYSFGKCQKLQKEGWQEVKQTLSTRPLK